MHIEAEIFLSFFLITMWFHEFLRQTNLRFQTDFQKNPVKVHRDKTKFECDYRKYSILVWQADKRRPALLLLPESSQDLFFIHSIIYFLIWFSGKTIFFLNYRQTFLGKTLASCPWSESLCGFHVKIQQFQLVECLIHSPHIPQWWFFF